MKKNCRKIALIALLCLYLFCNNFLTAQNAVTYYDVSNNIQGADLAYAELINVIEGPINVEKYPNKIDSVTQADKDECEIEEEQKPSIPAPLGCIISGITTICSGQSTTLTANQGLSNYTYKWSTGETTQSITVSPTSTSTYTVSASYFFENPQVCSQVVTVSPTASITGTNAVCAGNSTTLTASGGGTSYLWSPGGATAPSINLTPSGSNVYRVTVTYSSGCTSTALRAVSVTQYPTVTITGLDSICNGSSATLVSHCFNSGATYLWSTGQSPRVYTQMVPNPQTPTQYLTNISVSPTSSTVYSVTATAGPGCTASTSHLVKVNPLPTATAGSNSAICSGKTLNLTSSGGTSYSWMSTNGYYSATQNPYIQNATNGNAGIYTVTVTDNNSCSSTAQVVVEIIAQPIITNIVNNLICVGETIELKSNGGSSYQWSGPNGYSSSNPINTILDASLIRSGLYTVTVSNDDNCTSTATSIVFVSDKPVVSAGNDVIACYGTLVTLTATGGNTYTWSTGDHTSSITVNPRLTTSYTVEVQNQSGCKAVDQVEIIVKPAISLFLVITKPSNCTKGGIINLSGSEIGISYQLLQNGVALGDPILGTGHELFFQSVASNGTYTIKGTRVNDGCERIMNGSFVII